VFPTTLWENTALGRLFLPNIKQPMPLFILFYLYPISHGINKTNKQGCVLARTGHENAIKRAENWSFSFYRTSNIL